MQIVCLALQPPSATSFADIAATRDRGLFSLSLLQILTRPALHPMNTAQVQGRRLVETFGAGHMQQTHQERGAASWRVLAQFWDV